MISASHLDHPLTEIHPDSAGRLEGREKLSGSASELEDPKTFRDEESHVAAVVFVIEGVGGYPRVALIREEVGPASDRCLPGRYRVQPRDGRGFGLHGRSARDSTSRLRAN